MKGMEYTRVARAKILEMHLQPDCIGISDSSDTNITLKFAGKECTVDKFGKVQWSIALNNQNAQLVERFEITDITVGNVRYALMSDNMVKINFPEIKNTSFIHINDKDPLLPDEVVTVLNKMSSYHENESVINQLDEANKVIDNLFVGINDWMNDYAAEFCDEKEVKEARERINEFGTLAYIARLNDQVVKFKSRQAANFTKELT
jgi:hypothetical protein